MPLQVLAGLPLTWAHLMNVQRLWRLYGPTSVFASPGFGWTLPLTVALLVGAWFGDSAAPEHCLLESGAEYPKDASNPQNSDAMPLDGKQH